MATSTIYNWVAERFYGIDTFSGFLMKQENVLPINEFGEISKERSVKPFYDEEKGEVLVYRFTPAQGGMKDLAKVTVIIPLNTYSK
ncbi:hypothetical protein COV17_01950 [Candidatus Woesearchaeota archaeon CG10_big_fil_rev_8_21_14_0_10_36_11]|nr:MAG: hypothetical protein COV17_01950 [Candidatus Woesearchaeota archaeon CG10_big_fil_rev_8_21_14_0_10_36_11]